MRRTALDIALATAVFLAVSFVWNGTAAPLGTIFSALVFAMSYGAIRVGLVVFGRRDA
ncbi:hypothetical protein [Ruegeria marina]|uniref:Uncharacterized protein n=1 Tax=Ruegeria marina TaxID=639004 RepID=A0A1G6Q3L2_9RHOB|nr:hypothetical protein [Ruegeria marina]SDC87052.1 hypothetical protein SAMN04488239_10411 [Ruegeria marina]